MNCVISSNIYGDMNMIKNATATN